MIEKYYTIKNVVIASFVFAIIYVIIGHFFHVTSFEPSVTLYAQIFISALFTALVALILIYAIYSFAKQFWGESMGGKAVLVLIVLIALIIKGPKLLAIFK